MQTTDPFELDVRIPRHARAYLLAAGQFLSNWPQQWDAETLALALVDEESPNQKFVDVWDAIKFHVVNVKEDDVFLCADSLICDLAENFITFAQEEFTPLLKKASSRLGCGCGQSGLCKECCDVDLELLNNIKSRKE